MIELNALQTQILLSLTFPEPFDTLVEEIKATQPVIAAELKELIVLGLVQVMQEDARGRYTSSIFYDSDNMRAFQYQISSKGLMYRTS
jgi:predicted transcriptional regulator